MGPKRASKNLQIGESTSRSRRRVIHDSPPQSPPQSPANEDEEVGGGGMAEEVRRVGGGATKVRAGMYLEEGEIRNVTGNILFQYLDYQKLSVFTTFTSNWYPAIVYKFYESLRLMNTDNETVLCLRYNIDGVTGYLTENDIRRTFRMINLGADEYPERGWSTDWPVGLDNCVAELNNNRRVKRGGLAYKNNLNGIQKLLWKVISGIVLPSTSQATELSCVHSFVLWAILNMRYVNWPRIILKHMYHQRSKSSLQYGMILSYLLVEVKGVPIGECKMVEYRKDSKMGRQSLITQEVYMWEGMLRSKWEVFEQFSDVQEEVWRLNNCLPPKGWIPPTILATVDEDTEHGGAGSSSSTRSSDRSLLEAIHRNTLRIMEEQQRMRIEQERLSAEQEEIRSLFANMFP